MDFWSRLLAGTSLAPGSSRKDAAKDPVKRLHRFEKEYGQLLQTWRHSSNLARDDEAAERIETRLQELTRILSDESRRPLPHPCINFAAAKQIYIPIAKIATSSFNEYIINEAVLFFATLIESEEEAFVETDGFSNSLTNLLVRITGANSIRLASETEIRVVEVAFNITTKIRLEPDILPAWFKSNQQTAGARGQENDDREKFAGKTQKQDFPLFYLLMDYIHHEGKVGDFARTGLLYIIEAASHSVALEQWIVESDLSTLMATGLGALYSQLSRKLVIDHPPHHLPPILALSDYQHPTSTYEIVSSCAPDFTSHLNTFLSHLLFWQDVLNHCRSVEVKQTLLEHFQVIFLQQLLYPSLLESSDIDGGSSVAVLTYLRRILEALDHPDMINLVLHYLLGLPDTVPSSAAPTSVSAARQRKSMDLATMMASKNETTATPLLFNLVDLILACLRSQSDQTIYVTLQLVSAILKRHHRYAVHSLLRVDGIHGGNTRRTVGAHEQEVEYLMSLAGAMGGRDNFDDIYENVLTDAMSRTEGHPCSLTIVAPKLSVNNHKLPAIPDSLPGAPRDVRSHTLRPDDPLLSILLDRLETFFLNPVETNLALTEAIFDLGVCGYMNLEGWLLRHPQKYAYDEEEELAGPTSPGSLRRPSSPPAEPDSTSYAEFERTEAMAHCRRYPKWTPSSLPRFLTLLQTLTDQVSAYRESIPRFDDLVQQRREAFQTADSSASTALPKRAKRNPPSNAATPVPDSASVEESRSPSPGIPSAIEGFAQRLLAEIGSPSRSGSPRGRKESLRNPNSNTSMAGGYGIGTPTATSKPLPAPPNESASDTETTSKSRAGRSYSRGSRKGGRSRSHNSRDGPVASQVAAFHAVDQSILARRVGLPVHGVQPIPLKFEKKRTEEVGDDDKEVQDGKDTRENAREDAGEEVNVQNTVPDETTPAEEGNSENNTEEVPSPEHKDASQVDRDLDESKSEAFSEKTASVSHVITNVIVLQSFLFELAALVQIRAGLFNEVRFV